MVVMSLPAHVEADGGGVTSRAMAHTNPESSRAMATTILLCGMCRALSRLKRAHRRSCAVQAMSVTALGSSDWRLAIAALIRAGWRYRCATSTSMRRAAELPVLV